MKNSQKNRKKSKVQKIVIFANFRHFFQELFIFPAIASPVEFLHFSALFWPKKRKMAKNVTVKQKKGQKISCFFAKSGQRRSGPKILKNRIFLENFSNFLTFFKTKLNFLFTPAKTLERKFSKPIESLGHIRSALRCLPILGSLTPT